MGCSCIKMTYSVRLGRHFNLGMRMPLRHRKIDTKNGGIRGLWTKCRKANLGASAKNLVDTNIKVAKWLIAAARHTCRVMYIASPSQNHKNLENLSRSRPPEAIIDAVDGQGMLQTVPAELNPFFAYTQRKWNDFKQVVLLLGKNHISTARPETRKSPSSRPPVAAIGAVDGQVPVQTLVKALNTLCRYVQRKRNDFKQVVCCTW